MGTFEETIKLASDQIYEATRKYKPYPTVEELSKMLKEFPKDTPVFINTEEELVSIEGCKVLLETRKK